MVPFSTTRDIDIKVTKVQNLSIVLCPHQEFMKCQDGVFQNGRLHIEDKGKKYILAYDILVYLTDHSRTKQIYRRRPNIHPYRLNNDSYGLSQSTTGMIILIKWYRWEW